MALQTYQDCVALAQTRKRKLANNTYLQYVSASAYAVRLHDTNIITFYDDGRIMLNSGGWQTPTTKARLNEHLFGWAIWQDTGIWYLGGATRAFAQTAPLASSIHVFADGITIHPDGYVTHAGDPPEHILALRKQIRSYAKAYVKALRAGDVPKPGDSDCWGCLMVTKGNKHPLGGKNHILNHISDKYYVPSLLVNAMKAFDASPIAYHEVAYAWSKQPGEGLAIDFIWAQIEKAIRRWCYRECGLVL